MFGLRRQAGRGMGPRADKVEVAGPGHEGPDHRVEGLLSEAASKQSVGFQTAIDLSLGGGHCDCLVLVITWRRIGLDQRASGRRKRP
jgi:hypothetical protein